MSASSEASGTSRSCTRRTPSDELRLEPAEAARWLRYAWRLVAGTLAYNLVELAVALWAGIRAGSVALVGFGLDSGIEAAAAVLLLCRRRGLRDQHAEQPDELRSLRRRLFERQLREWHLRELTSNRFGSLPAVEGSG